MDVDKEFYLALRAEMLPLTDALTTEFGVEFKAEHTGGGCSAIIANFPRYAAAIWISNAGEDGYEVTADADKYGMMAYELVLSTLPAYSTRDGKTMEQVGWSDSFSTNNQLFDGEFTSASSSSDDVCVTVQRLIYAVRKLNRKPLDPAFEKIRPLNDGPATLWHERLAAYTVVPPKLLPPGIL